LGCLATAQFSRHTLASCGACHCRLGGYPYSAEQSCARLGREPALPVLVVREMQRHQKYLEQRMTRLRREALRLIAGDSELDRRFRLMLTTTGIAETSALQILGELAVLPEMLDARQWVAFCGLDPRLFKSGKSVEKRPRISRGGSRHLRRALYMPALVALRRDPYLRRFYQNLLARGKARRLCESYCMLCLPCSAPINRTTDRSCAAQST
jgi:transposase